MTASLPSSLDLLVRENDPRQCRFVEAAAPDPDALAAGEVLVRVEKFGLSANNVTYAVLGQSPIINYFDFFPTNEPGWGRVPVWGMGTIVASRHPELRTGERMYGYFPLARWARLRPARITPLGFEVDRGALPAVYGQYTLTRADPFHLPANEDAMIVFRPLVLTAILLDDFLAEHGWFGAESVLIASASSKTAFALAAMLARRRDRPPVIGLTSPRNAAFVRSLGLYGRVVTYDVLAELPRETPAVVVDVAGDAEVRSRLRAHLGDRLAMTVTVGLSHWEKAGGVAAAEEVAGSGPAAEPTVFFFAPAWVEKRREDWGPATLGERIATAWHEFMSGVDRWIRIVRGEGQSAVASVYGRLVDGTSAPDEAHVLSL